MAKTFKNAATITIKDAAKMSADGRTRVAAWLRRQANTLEQEGKDYAPSFTANYEYQEGK